MFDIKKLLAITTCAVVSAACLSACGEKDKDDDNDDFSINPVVDSNTANDNNNVVNSDIVLDPNATNREFEETLGVLAEEYDYYGLKYTVNKVSELEFEQYPGGKVLIVDLTLTNNSEYAYYVGAYQNFDVLVNGAGQTPEFVTAQVMTITTKYFINEGIDRQVFGMGEAPPIQPGETLSGYLPIALTSDIVDFETITVKFLPDSAAGVYSNISVDITPADVTPFTN